MAPSSTKRGRHVERSTRPGFGIQRQSFGNIHLELNVFLEKIVLHRSVMQSPILCDDSFRCVLLLSLLD